MPRFLFCLPLLMTGSLLAEVPKPSGSAAILPENSRLETLWEDGGFTEGVAAAANGEIYFSDIAFGEGNGRVMKFSPTTGKVTTHCANSLQSNGLMFDRKGRLLAACGANRGGRCLAEITPAGKVTTLVDNFDGKKLNSPNDLVIHPNGNVYFSDPRYVGDESVELSHMSVYLYQPDTNKLFRVTENIEKPNGVMISPDGKTLYVAETNNGSLDVRKEDENVKPGRMTLNSFPIKKNGSLGKKTVLVDFQSKAAVDGMTVDNQGNIYAAVRTEERFGIRIYSPQGKELAYIPTVELPTNCCFGVGKESSTLYITSGTGLYRIDLKTTGWHPARGE